MLKYLKYVLPAFFVAINNKKLSRVQFLEQNSSWAEKKLLIAMAFGLEIKPLSCHAQFT